MLNYIKILFGFREFFVEDLDLIRLEFIFEGEEDVSFNFIMYFVVDLSGRVYFIGVEVY